MFRSPTETPLSIRRHRVQLRCHPHLDSLTPSQVTHVNGSRFRLCALLSAAVFGFASSAAAQAVLVRVVAAESGQPLQGALVTLTTPEAGFVRSVLSDGAGRAAFLALTPGVYGIRSELIGRETHDLSDIVVGTDRARQMEIRMASRAIQLEGLSVDGEERCRIRPEEGLRVAQVWDEARKALAGARRTEEGGTYRYRTRTYIEDRSSTGDLLGRESQRLTSYGAAPYSSLPAAHLLANGFVQEADDESESVYYAPDAAVLLSNEFLDTHCLRLRRGRRADEGLVGLGFEPLGDRRIVDISGTLWLDPTTWELVRLDYTYERLHPQVELRDVGGMVEFQRLPDGSWIVPEWTIRMPRLVRGLDLRGRPVVRQEGLRTQGGRLLSVSEQSGGVLLSASAATVEGVVLQEISSIPVAGAVVRIGGTDHQAVTGLDGMFRFTELGNGPYDLLLDHPTMAPYGYRPEPIVVEAREGDVTSVQLRLPSPLSIVERTCRDVLDTRMGGTAALLGTVVDEGTGLPMAGATVVIEWENFSIHKSADARVVIGVGGMSAQAIAGPTGSYRSCEVPENTKLTVWARVGEVDAPSDTVRIPAGEPVATHTVVVPGIGGRK